MDALAFWRTSDELARSSDRREGRGRSPGRHRQGALARGIVKVWQLATGADLKGALLLWLELGSGRG